MLKKGFTIVEVLIAAFIVSVGITGVLIAIQQTMAYIDFLFPRLTAIYLAQEGIEIVKNIRDGNWLENRYTATSWDQGIDVGDRQADYQTTQTLIGYTGQFLLLDGGFYNYSSGNPTLFKRKIIISDKQDLDGDFYADQMRVEVKVGWEAKGYHEISAEEILYNWRE